MAKCSEKSGNQRTKVHINDAFNLARGFFENGDNMRALELTERTISEHVDVDSCHVHHELQGDIFFKLAEQQDITDIKCIYHFASVGAYAMAIDLFPNGLRSFRGYARSLIQLGDHLMMKKFYEKAVIKAKRGISVTQRLRSFREDLKDELQELMNIAVEKVEANMSVTTAVTMSNQVRSIEEDLYGLKNFWATLDDKTKREFLVIDITNLTDFIENTYGSRVKVYFQNCVTILHTLHWRCWKCHICSQVNYCFTDCKIHIMDKHVNKFEPEFSARPKYVDGDFADMVSSGNWKPVDTENAATLILSRTKRKEEFVYVNGWCNDWPVAENEDRENILKEFSEALKSSCSKESCTLSSSIWEWLRDYTEEHLELTGVPGRCLDKCSFFNTPQCICFLDQIQLERILKYFRQDVRTSLVSKIVNKFWENSQVRERIDLQGVTTYNLLLDKRLLCEADLKLDNIETIRHYKSTGIYENVMPKGDKIISWVFDCPKIDELFVTQMAKGVHNREIWFAVLRMLQSMDRKKVSYYGKRQKLLVYDKMLGEVEAICNREDSRKNSNQRRRYVSMLQVKCEELVGKQDDDTKCFWNVVRDILEKQESPRFEVVKDEEIKQWISKLSSNIQDYGFNRSLRKLRKSLKEKFGLIDAKILLNEYTYEKLAHEFPKLSVVEYRLVVLPFVKKFLQDKLKKMMKTNSSSVAARDSAEGGHKKRRV